MVGWLGVYVCVCGCVYEWRPVVHSISFVFVSVMTFTYVASFLFTHLVSMGSSLKSIRVHLSPGSSSGLVAYTLRILAQWYTFFMGHTAIF